MTNRNTSVFSDIDAQEEYQLLFRRVWLSNVVPAHELLKIVQAIDDMPRPLKSDFEHVLSMLNYASLQTAALRVINLLTDTRSRRRRPLTLRHLRNELLRLCADEHRDDLRRRCANAFRSDREIAEMLDRAKKVRDKVLAHEDEDADGSLRLERAEIASLLAKCKSLLDVLQPEGGQGYDVQTLHSGDSIQGLLRLIARASTRLNLPEREHPEVWKYKARRMTEPQRSRFNRWRRQYGLPEVDFDAT